MPSFDDNLQHRMQRLDSLLAEIDAFADPEAQAKTRQIVRDLMDYHGAALARIIDHLTQADASGQAIVTALTQDALVNSLLLLYDLHPLDLEARVRQALDKVRPFLAQHHGNVEFLGITDDAVVRLRLQGNCHGCPSSRATLKSTIEEALYAAAPDIAGLDVEGAVGEATPPPEAVGFVAATEVRYHGCPIPTTGIH